MSVPVTGHLRLHTQKPLLQIAAQKLLQALAFRVVEHLVRMAGFFDLALVQEHHLTCNLARKAHLVGDQNHGPTFFGQALNDLQHFTDQFRVQRRSRFVEQHDFRLHRQRPCNRHALLLAAGEECRVLIGNAFRQPDFFQVLARASLGFGLGNAQYPARCHGDVFQHGHVRPQVEVLKHHRQARADALQLVRVGNTHPVLVADHAHLLAIQAHRAVIGLFEKIDAAQKGTLAGAAGTDQADHVTAAGLERYAFEHFVVAIAFVQAIDGQFVHDRSSRRK
ncbi:hypothetical protein ALP17_112272 [Pseudomonas savastanoi]|uniref:Uncharacterized protein n=1 Tax=Pseudomonas savastanoi TaxID=29438 RepID=A0A3M5ZQ72_PSESS|nr:hypothetical protein ALP17_112272 [Pseudomonas savastanoi]